MTYEEKIAGLRREIDEANEVYDADILAGLTEEAMDIIARLSDMLDDRHCCLDEEDFD